MQPETTKDRKNKVFEKLYGRSLTKKESYEIRKNLTGFFEILVQIDQTLRKKERLDNAN
jgi:hypothetical protein